MAHSAVPWHVLRRLRAHHTQVLQASRSPPPHCHVAKAPQKEFAEFANGLKKFPGHGQRMPRMEGPRAAVPSKKVPLCRSMSQTMTP